MTTQTTEPLPQEPATRRLTRSSEDRVIAGVGGGFGRYIGVDPVVVRLALIVLVFFGGAGVILYAAAWLIVPAEGDGATGFDGRGLARRLGVALGVLALTLGAAFAGLWGFARGSGTTTAVVIIAVGAILAVVALRGAGRWLIVPAFALVLAAGAAAATNLDLRGGVGDRIYQPLSSAALRPSYRLGAGHLRVDLRYARLTPGPHRLHLSLGAGEAEVLVPPNVCVSSRAHVTAGATTVFDRTTGGSEHDWQDPHSAPAGTPLLIVDADIGLGQLRIEPSPKGEQPPSVACANG